MVAATASRRACHPLHVSRIVAVLILLIAAPASADDACDEVKQALRAKDITRASIAVADCAALDADVTAAAEAAGYSAIEVVTKPAGGTVLVDTAADRPFVTPRKIWVASGLREFTALVDGQPAVASSLSLRDHSRAVVLIELPEAPPPVGVREVDFTDDEGGPELTRGGPADEKFGSLLPDRYLRGVTARGEGEAARARRGWWRLGIGVATRTVTASAGGLALELERRAGVGGPWWIAASVQLVGGYIGDSELGEMGGAVLQAGAAITMQAAHPVGGFDLRAAAGPSVATVRAPFDGTGSTLGVTAGLEAARRWYTLGLRGEVPVLATDQHAFTVAGLFGVRW